MNMREEVNLLHAIMKTLKRSLKWYIYPLIYFTVSSLVCLYAWYRPYPKGAVKIIFKTITLLPSLFSIGIITLWIILVIIFSMASFYMRRKYPNIFKSALLMKITHIIKGQVDTTASKEVGRPPQTFWRKVINSIVYLSGTILIVSGILLLIWIARPYFSLLLSASKIEALDKKVSLGQVQGNRIIIPSILVDASIMEGVSKINLSRGVCHISQSPHPGEGGNFIIEGHNLAEFGLWKPQSFFSLLDVLEKGAPVYVFYKGKKYKYKVKEKTKRDINDPKLYDLSPGERLTLLSCVSTWSPTIYTNKRTVIIAYPE